MSPELQVVKNKNKSLKLQLYKFADSNYDLHDFVYNLENQINELNQYSRRENIELQNVPESVEQKDFESFILVVFKSIDVDVSSYDLVAVHRIGKLSSHRRNVIVRFVISIYKNICITENLCPTYRKIFNRLYKLKKENVIRNVWRNDGHVFCKLSDESDERSLLLKHFDDIDYYLNK